MGSCCSCLSKDRILNRHPTKFKVTNVDDEGVELGAGVMELLQRELVLHLQQREPVRWPYLCLRRYGFDANLFSFESGRRCQTGQGIFAFKCSRAEEIFNLLQELMQSNSISVTEEPSPAARSGLPSEPRALGCTVSSLSNGFPGCSGAGSRSSARRSSAGSLRHPSLGEEPTHALIARDEQSHTYVNTPAAGAGEDDPHRSRAPSLPGRRGPRALLRQGQVQFVLGPAPARRHVVRCQGPGPHDPPHHNNNEGPSECAAQPQCAETAEGAGGQARRRPGAALLHYENLPALPPVWEGDGRAPSSGGLPDSDAQAEGDRAPQEQEQEQGQGQEQKGAGLGRPSLPVPLARGSPRVFSFDPRRPGPEPPRQLNYVQVELQGRAGDGPQEPQSPAGPARSADSYAVIDLKKTVAMSNLQRALPRDDGTARKTRHNSTDLPL